MARIRINIANSLVSESAAKKPAYRVHKFGGVTTLLINSAKKAELQAVVGHLKKAKTAAVAGITASIKSNTAATKARQLPRGDKRTKLMATRKTEKAKATAEIKTAKAALREANKVAKAHGLGGLNLPLSAADIKTGVGADKALKAIRAAKLTEFGVTGKRGAFKPKFLKEAAFDAISEKKKTSTAKPGMGPRAAVKKTQKVLEKEETSHKVNTSLTKVLKKLGLKNEGTRLVDKKGKLLDKNGATRQHTIDDIREEFDAAGLQTKSLANGGFVVPGVFKINNSNYFGIEALPLKNWVHPNNMKKTKKTKK